MLEELSIAFFSLSFSSNGPMSHATLCLNELCGALGGNQTLKLLHAPWFVFQFVTVLLAGPVLGRTAYSVLGPNGHTHCVFPFILRCNHAGFITAVAAWCL